MWALCMSDDGDSFLTGAFAPHPADDVANNPFAEGASEQDEAQRRRAASEGAQDDAQPHPPFGNAPAGLGGATPLNYLFSLLNSFGAGGNGQVMFGQNGQTGNVGDFAWGEAGFQAILNDLMEQVSQMASPDCWIRTDSYLCRLLGEQDLSQRRRRQLQACTVSQSRRRS